MKPTLIKIKQNGQTIFDSDQEWVKSGIVSSIINAKGEYSDITVTQKNGDRYSAKKFIVGELFILKMMGSAFYLWLQEGMEIIIRK